MFDLPQIQAWPSPQIWVGGSTASPLEKEFESGESFDFEDGQTYEFENP